MFMLVSASLFAWLCLLLLLALVRLLTVTALATTLTALVF
jgi:hypothetical protein